MLDGAEKPPAVIVLDRALEIFGPNGEHWRQDYIYDRHGNHCILGAIRQARRDTHIKPKLDQTEKLLATRLCRERFGPDCSDQEMLMLFNNASGRTFEEIRDLMIWGLETALRSDEK